PGLVFGTGADKAEHGSDRESAARAPVDRVALDPDDPILIPDPRTSQPRGHGAVAATESGEAKRVERDRSHVDREYHAGLGPVDVDAAACGITAAQKGT